VLLSDFWNITVVVYCCVSGDLVLPSTREERNASGHVRSSDHHVALPMSLVCTLRSARLARDWNLLGGFIKCGLFLVIRSNGLVYISN